MARREYVKQIAFAALIIGFSSGLYFIVPQNKAFLLVIVAVVVLLTAIASLNMLDSRRLRIDYDRGLLVCEKPKIGIGLCELGKSHWDFVNQRFTARVTIITVIKLLRTGLFLLVDGKRINCINRVDEKDYRYLANHCSAPVVCIYSGKHSQSLGLGVQRLEIEGFECSVACSMDEIEFLDAEARLGIFKKKMVKKLRLSIWGGSFTLGKTDLNYEMIRPFTAFI